ncbi:type III pantothenate kinase [bacterium]|nr:type III pantothenate kinase [bacterium]
MSTVAIDIGNGRIKIGYFRNNRLKHSNFISTGSFEDLTFDSQWQKEKVSTVGISSVVPKVNSDIKKKIAYFFPDAKIMEISVEDCGIPLRIKNPDTIGVDRVVNCVAALELFGGNTVVVDMGTAITVDIISKKREFLGGVIMPGYNLWVKSLYNTAMIKPCENSVPRIPGKNTGEAISAGVKYGFLGAINNILEKVFKKFPEATLLLTGGDATRFCSSIQYKNHLNKNLTLEGINYVVARYT